MAKRRQRTRRTRRDTVAIFVTRVLALAIIAALLAIAASVALDRYRERQRIAAAWKKVGSCRSIGDSPTVTCRGVRLTTIRLPPSFAVCERLNPCEARVNVEAVPAFRIVFREIVAAGLGRHITDFGTVNRRRCKDARTGEFLPNCISKHSYGIAVDVRSFADNADWDGVLLREPGMGQVVRIFRENGFTWGGTFKRNFDPQHFEWRPGFRPKRRE